MEKQKQRGNVENAGSKSKLQIIILNVNIINSPIKSQKLLEWVNKHVPTIYYLQKLH